MTTRSRRFYAVFALLATLCWGAGVTMTKIALQDFPPPQLLIIQLLASVACLLLVALVLGQVPRSMGATIRVMWLGALEPGLAYFLGLEGLVDQVIHPRRGHRVRTVLVQGSDP